MKRMSITLGLIISTFLSATNMQSHYMCLTWSLENKSLLLNCTILSLKFKVEFVDPSGNNQGFCLPPHPIPQCITASKNVSITQNVTTKSTLFTLKGYIDKYVNGKWTCRHGKNLGSAMADVQIIAATEKDRDLMTACLPWSTFPFIAVVTFAFVMQQSMRFTGHKASSYGRNKKSCCPFRIKYNFVVLVFKIFIMIASAVLICIVPMVIVSDGKEDQSIICSGLQKGMMVAFGTLIGILFTVGIFCPIELTHNNVAENIDYVIDDHTDTEVL
ncbi:uncharacterized protein LOC143046737 [Mytilus galloprovincialis]|uniref:uncharacterized protein LOC143046737 n=1 Tax=Mytilus galloprovincialis TaxID=29158 RepID=UPI003F7B7AB3